MGLAAGTRVGPYEILALIGAGGMGEVWKARDTRLGRTIAIKFLHGAQTDRFEREARAIAALNHPYICTLYDIGPDYLVMEYVEGAPLHGPLPPEETLHLARQIAEALEAAHDKGITHRDLKPGNILMTASGIKLLDFGLAKLHEATLSIESTITQTQAGMILGSPAYMSPEQAAGALVDSRSDLFSFGLVLYEMLSGRRAFGGSNSNSTIAAILHKEPEPLQGPPEFDSIIRRCLRKNPADRYQTVAELRSALESVKLTPAAAMASIAVLPFANMSGDKENEYFSDGLSEEIINELAHVSGLKVIARTSAFAFKGKQEDIRKIAETLGVNNILEGSVRRAGNRVRVMAQLITALDGSNLWSERYDREMADIFVIQDEIAQAIAAALKMRLSEARRGYNPPLPAYEAYLRARHYMAAFTRESLARSRQFFEAAIALDSGFAPAHSGLAMSLIASVLPGLSPAREAMPLARAAAQRALDLDPDSQEAHAALAMFAALFDFDWEEAKRRFGLAMAREPVPPYVRWNYGFAYLLPNSRPQEAAEESRRGLTDDPLSFMGRFHYAGGLIASGNDEAGEAELRELCESHPNLSQPFYLLGLSQALRGLHAEALATAESAYSRAPWSTATTGLFAGALMRAGETRRANELLQKLLPGDQYGSPMGLLLFHLVLSELDRAADWARQVLEQRDPRIILVMAFMRAQSRNTVAPGSKWSTLADTLHIPGGV
jgi:serine/threonine protein kinase